MNQTNNTIQFSQFAAVSKDSDEVLGKILYYTLSSILIDREVLARLCDTVDFPYASIGLSEAGPHMFQPTLEGRGEIGSPFPSPVKICGEC